jgi:hypothetical protein
MLERAQVLLFVASAFRLNFMMRFDVLRKVSIKIAVF